MGSDKSRCGDLNLSYFIQFLRFSHILYGENAQAGIPRRPIFEEGFA
jgi:hypothetical protein